MIVHKDRNRPYICHPFASPVIILCQDGKRCEAFLRLCIVYHDVGTSTLKVIQFPIKSFVMWIANCLTCGCGSGDADALSALLLLTALNSLTWVWWSWHCCKSFGNKGIVCLFFSQILVSYKSLFSHMLLFRHDSLPVLHTPVVA